MKEINEYDFVSSNTRQGSTTDPKDQKKKTRIDRILDNMSVEDMIGQMSQVQIKMLLDDENKNINYTALQYYVGELGVGSIFSNVNNIPWTARDFRKTMIAIQETAYNYSRPPVLWGIDGTHGSSYIHGVTLTPQPINLAATFNVSTAYETGKLSSRDTRAAGIQWLYTPLVGLAVQPKWSRVYETFGEDPLVVGEMATHMIQGIQRQERVNSTARPSRAAACAKHFLGYSNPTNGHDRSPARIPYRQLYQYYVPPWKKVIDDGGVLAVMESYSEIDGVPMVTNGKTINTLLRQQLQFDKVLITDFEEILHLYNWHHIAIDNTDATIHSITEASIDISMVPFAIETFRNGILHGIENKQIYENRIRDSTKRILQLKDNLNMFDERKIQLDDPNLDLVGKDEKLVMDIIHQSIILVKNDNNILPLESSTNDNFKILITGPTSNSKKYQSGGWTYQWEGAPNEDWFTYGSTVYNAFGKNNWTNGTITYQCGIDILGNECESDSISKAVEDAKVSDVIIICIGEESYAEKPGDIRSLLLPNGQYEFVETLSKQSNAKIILVYFGGRPRLIGPMVEQADAVFIAFLPGPSAGDALVDLINGSVNPSARLPITYPLFEDGGGSPYYHSVSDMCTKGKGPLPHYQNIPCEVQFPFGHGLSYTTFSYEDFEVSGGINANDLKVSVKVKNTGNRAGAETVMIFTFDEYRRTTPEYKRLRAFDKVFLQPEESILLNFTVAADDLRFVGPHDETHYIHDPEMSYWVGVGASTDCRVEHANKDMCVYIHADARNHNIQVGKNDLPYIAACDAACALWTQSKCYDDYGFSEYACKKMCTKVSSHPPTYSDLLHEGWGWNYVNCLESVVVGLERSSSHNLQDDNCWKMTTLCRDIFHTGEMDEYGIGPHRHLDEGRNGNPPITYAMALLAALISTLIIMHQLMGPVRRFEHIPQQIQNNEEITNRDGTMYQLLENPDEEEEEDQEQEQQQ